MPFIEPIGTQREVYYEQRLLLALPWYCPMLPETQEDGGKQEWTYKADFNPQDLGGVELDPVVLKLGLEYPSSEMICNETENQFCSHEHDLICRCCNEELPNSPCDKCRYTVGFHRCDFAPHLRWKKGSLHAGVLDVQRVLFNLHRRQLPINVMRERAQSYVDAGLISSDVAQRIITIILSERRYEEHLNDVDEPQQDGNNLTTKLTQEQMERLLDERVEMMRKGRDGEVTDQIRVYEYIIGCMQRGEYLRLLVQASAGILEIEK